MKSKRRKPKTVYLTCSGAVRAIEQMYPLLRDEVKMALWFEIVLETGNNYLVGNRAYLQHGLEAYHATSSSFILNLIMMSAKLYDEGNNNRHANDRDVVSLPLLVRLLRQKRCRKELVRRARRWIANDSVRADANALACEQRIDTIVSRWADFRRKTSNRNALKRIKAERNTKFAHLLLPRGHSGNPTLPTFGHFFAILRNARQIVEDLAFVVEGTDLMLDEFEEGHKDEAEAFWVTALHVKPEVTVSFGTG